MTTVYNPMLDMWTMTFQPDGDEEAPPLEEVYPKPDSVKLNSPVTAETEEERERLWNLVRQYSSG